MPNSMTEHNDRPHCGVANVLFAFSFLTTTTAAVPTHDEVAWVDPLKDAAVM